MRDPVWAGDGTIETAATIAAFAAAEWDALLRPHDYFRHAYLAALEASGLDCQFRYVALRNQAGIVALGFGYVTRFKLPYWQPRVFLAGTPVNLGYPFACAPGWDNPATWHRLQEALYRSARELGAYYYLLRDLSAQEAQDAAPSLGLLPMPLHATALLTLPYEDIEDYLSSLSKSRRQTVRRDKRAVTEAGYILTAQAPAPELAPRLLALWMPLYLKYQDPDQICLTEGYFRQMAQHPHAEFLLLWKDGQLVAFDICLKSGPLLSSLFSGIAEDLPRDTPIHRYMGYAIIERALALGCTDIDFGISNEAAKQRMGCELQMLHGAGRAVPILLHRLGVAHLVKRAFAAPAPQDGEEGAGVLPPAAPQAPAINRGRKRVIVIGAGLSGLAAAARLARDPHLEICLVDRATDVGGHCRNVRFEGEGLNFIAGTNLYSPRAFRLLDKHYGIRLPTRRVNIQTRYQGAELGSGALLRAFASATQVQHLAKLAAASLTHCQSIATALARPPGQARLFDDMLLAPFLLQGQDPAHWPLRKGLAKMRHLDACLYPLPGVQSVPQALLRAAQRNKTLHLHPHTEAQSLLLNGEKLAGLCTNTGEIEADLLVSALGGPANLALLQTSYPQASDAAPLPAPGLSATAVFLLLDPTFATLPRGAHTTLFLNHDVKSQLEALFAGEIPVRPDFDLISTDLSAAQASPHGWRLTLFITAPRDRGDAETADALWRAILPQLDNAFPGFTAAIRWQRIVAADDYPATIGSNSQLSPFAGYAAPPLPSAQPGHLLPAGLYLIHGLTGPACGDACTALAGGWRHAEKIALSFQTRDAH